MSELGTPEDHEALAAYTDIILNAADKLANEDEFKGAGGGVQAVAVVVRTVEGWGGHRTAGPEEWGPVEEFAFLFGAVTGMGDALGYEVRLEGIDLEERVRPLPRNRRRRHRRR